MSILSYFSTQCLPDSLGPMSRTIPSSVIAGKHGILRHSFQNGRNNCLVYLQPSCYFSYKYVLVCACIIVENLLLLKFSRGINFCGKDSARK